MVRVKSFKYKMFRGEPIIAKTLLRIECAAKINSWSIIKYHDINLILNLRRGDEIMDIYLSNMTVRTCIDHPKRGKTQLIRKKISIEELQKLMENVRTHTGKGYYNEGYSPYNKI